MIKFTKNTAWKLFNGVTIVLALIIVISLVVSQGIGTLSARLSTLNFGWLIVAVACMVAFWLLESFLLHIICSSLYKSVPFRSSLHTVMIGQLYSALTPFASGGQPVQLLAMQQDGMDAGGAGSALTFKSLTWQCGLTAFGIMGAIYGWQFFSEHVQGFAAIFTVALLINLVVITAIIMFATSKTVTAVIVNKIIWLLEKLHLTKNPQRLLERARKQFIIFHKSISLFTNKRRVWGASVVVTFCQFFTNYMVVYAIYRAFGQAEFSPFMLISAVALVSLIAAFIPLPGGSGGAEGAFCMFFAMFYSQTDLLIALLIWRIVTYYQAIIIGAVALFFERNGRQVKPKLHKVFDDVYVPGEDGAV